MAATDRSGKSGRDKARSPRDGMRFRAAAHRESLAVASSTHAREDQDFIDAMSDRPRRHPSPTSRRGGALS